MTRYGTGDELRHGIELALFTGMDPDRRGFEASEASAIPERPSEAQRATLVAWLDGGLRRGDLGRLAREYPLSMEGSCGHRCIFDGEQPVAHAMMHPAGTVARGRRLCVGMIGNVYTSPAHRGRGLASACVAACAHDAQTAGASVVLLWSDAPDFYRPLGFHPTGRESLLGLRQNVIEKVARTIRTPICVGPPMPAEWSALETLYDAKPVRAARAPGELVRLAAAPETTLRVARRAGVVCGYAAAGRGDDFRGVIHEWAGDEDGVLACVADLVASGDAEALMHGPAEELPVQRLLEAGAPRRTGAFALGRILDATRLFETVAPGEGAVAVVQRGEEILVSYEGARHALGMEQALELFFGQGVEGVATGDWPDALRERLAAHLPHPLYVWGFDSV